MTLNGNFWTTHAEWMAQVGPRHLELERQGWWCGFSPAKRNALKTKTESSLATSAGTFLAAPKHWGLEWVWPARGWQSKELQDHGRLTMACVPIMGGITVFSVYFHHTEEWTERNQQILEATSREIRRCPGQWILAGDFNMEPGAFGQQRLPGVLVKPAAPTFRHGASARCFDYFVVHRAVACQIREVRVLEDSGISPHHPVQMKLKRSFQGLVTRVQATPRALPSPIVGCAREPHCWDFDQSASMDERWTQLLSKKSWEDAMFWEMMRRAHMGRGVASRWVIRKVAPAKSHNRPHDGGEC